MLTSGSKSSVSRLKLLSLVKEETSGGKPDSLLFREWSLRRTKGVKGRPSICADFEIVVGSMSEVASGKLDAESAHSTARARRKKDCLNMFGLI